MKYVIDILRVRIWIVVAVVFFCVSARAGPYELEIIVRAGDVIDGQTILSAFSSNPINIEINNDGEVAFLGQLALNGGDWAVMTQRRFIAGAGKAVDGHLPIFDNQDHALALNNQGQVAYTAFLPEPDGSFSRGLFAGETFLFRPGDVIDGITIITLNDVSPAINDDGTVVVVARHTAETGPDRRDGLFTQDEMILESGAEIDGHRIGGFTGTEISNTGEIFFTTSLPDLGLEFDRAIVTPDRIVIKSGDVIGGQRIDLIDGFSINGNGDLVVGFRRFSDMNPDDRSLDEGFIATETEILVKQGDVVDGLTIDGARDPGLNNAGQLAFFATVENETGGAPRLVLFADDHVVVAEGDLLDGKVIKRLRRFDINDRGDLAFYVEFEDLSKVIVRASHVQIPEPDALVLAAIGLIALFSVQRRLPRATRRRAAQRAGGR